MLWLLDSKMAHDILDILRLVKLRSRLHKKTLLIVNALPFVALVRLSVSSLNSTFVK
jgi:hypothetical protein